MKYDNTCTTLCSKSISFRICHSKNHRTTQIKPWIQKDLRQRKKILGHFELTEDKCIFILYRTQIQLNFVCDVLLLHSTVNVRSQIEHGCWVVHLHYLSVCLSCLSAWRKFSTAEDCVRGMENEWNRKLSSLSRTAAFQTESFQQLFWLFRWVDVTELFFGPN